MPTSNNWVIGSKSLILTGGSFESRIARKTLLVMIRKVCPSGSLFATNDAATIPEAPVLASTTTGWPILGDNLSAMTRAAASMTPPAAKGTMAFSGLVNSGVWADAAAGGSSNADPPSKEWVKSVRRFIVGFLPGDRSSSSRCGRCGRNTTRHQPGGAIHHECDGGRIRAETWTH